MTTLSFFAHEKEISFISFKGNVRNIAAVYQRQRKTTHLQQIFEA